MSVSDTYSAALAAALAAALRTVSTALPTVFAVTPGLDGGRGTVWCIETGTEAGRLDVIGAIAKGLRLGIGSCATFATRAT
ncbi:MAG: hypothetical protein M3122_00015 [Actinomycetota bacterium]|nr:hypothetical protein [Actinomycetota bacterium]